MIAGKYKVSRTFSYTTRSLSPLTSRFINIQEWNDPEFKSVCVELFGDEKVPLHRKVWEFVSTIRALRAMGVMHGDSLGLSIAAGTERILFYLANQSRGIVASDIYGNGDFSSLEATSAFLFDQENFSPFPYVRDNLCAAYANALSLPFSDACFDYVISMSSIEHFGGLKKSIIALQEANRVLRPRGVCVITTDVSLNGFVYDQSFSIANIALLVKHSGFEICEDLSYTTSAETLTYLCDMYKDDWLKLPHINLKSLASIFTSYILILKKKGSALQETEESIRNRKRLVWVESEQSKNLAQENAQGELEENFFIRGFKKNWGRVLNRIRVLLFYVYEAF